MTFQHLSHQIAERLSHETAYPPDMLFHASDVVTRWLIHGDQAAHAALRAAHGDPHLRDLYGRAKTRAWENPLFWTTYYARQAELHPVTPTHPWRGPIRRGFAHLAQVHPMPPAPPVHPGGAQPPYPAPAGYRWEWHRFATRALGLAQRHAGWNLVPVHAGVPPVVIPVHAPAPAAATAPWSGPIAQTPGAPAAPLHPHHHHHHPADPNAPAPPAAPAAPATATTTSGGPHGMGGRNLGHPAGWRWAYHYGGHDPRLWSGPYGLGVDYLQEQEAILQNVETPDDGEPEWNARHRDRSWTGD
jgi:hypothetical protein